MNINKHLVELLQLLLIIFLDHVYLSFIFYFQTMFLLISYVFSSKNHANQLVFFSYFSNYKLCYYFLFPLCLTSFYLSSFSFFFLDFFMNFIFSQLFISIFFISSSFLYIYFHYFFSSLAILIFFSHFYISVVFCFLPSDINIFQLPFNKIIKLRKKTLTLEQAISPMRKN